MEKVNRLRNVHLSVLMESDPMMTNASSPASHLSIFIGGVSISVTSICCEDPLRYSTGLGLTGIPGFEIRIAAPHN